MHKRNVFTRFAEAYSWASNTAKEKTYVAPKNAWGEFLYAMSYNKGEIAQATKKKHSQPKIEITTTMTTPQSPSIPTHAYASSIHSESLISKGGMLR